MATPQYIRLRYRPGRVKCWAPETVADARLVSMLMGKQYLEEAEYETILRLASDFGMGIETTGDPEDDE